MTFFARIHICKHRFFTGYGKDVQYCAGGKIEKNGMGGACGMYGGGESCAQGFGGAA